MVININELAHHPIAILDALDLGAIEIRLAQIADERRALLTLARAAEQRQRSAGHSVLVPASPK